MRAMILLTGLFLTPVAVQAAAFETERYSAEDHLHVTYRQATARTFTMSGLKGDHIVYVRAVATCKGIAAATLWVEYPQSERPQLDSLIAHMAKTLIGSNACWAPG